MRAIILAAGRGSRMGHLTDDLPKCRTRFLGKELIQWQLDALQRAGIDDISVVRGYLADSFGYDLKYFYNPDWHRTNMVSSLLAASSWLEKYSCIVSYSDIVYSASAVELLMESETGISITYDPNWQALWEMRFSDPLTDAESFRFEEGRVVEIGKSVASVAEIEGQYMGLLKFNPRGWSQVMDHLQSLHAAGVGQMDMTSLLQALIEAQIEVGAVEICDRWYEIDSQYDLELYESMSTISGEMF